MSNIHIIEIPEEEKVTGAEKKKSERYPKFNEKYQFTDPRGSVNNKRDK